MKVTQQLRNAQSLSKRINKLYHEAVDNIKDFLINEVGVGNVLEIPEDVEFTIDTTEEGGDFAYVSNIRIVKPWEGVENVYDIQFTWECGNPNVEKDWKRLDDYNWDLDSFVEAIILAVEEY